MLEFKSMYLIFLFVEIFYNSSDFNCSYNNSMKPLARVMQETTRKVEINERSGEESVGAVASLEDEGIEGLGLGDGEGCEAGFGGGDEGGLRRKKMVVIDQGLQPRGSKEERVSRLSSITRIPITGEAR